METNQAERTEDYRLSSLSGICCNSGKSLLISSCDDDSSAGAEFTSLANSSPVFKQIKRIVDNNGNTRGSRNKQTKSRL